MILDDEEDWEGAGALPSVRSRGLCARTAAFHLLSEFPGRTRGPRVAVREVEALPFSRLPAPVDAVELDVESSFVEILATFFLKKSCRRG